MVPGRDEHPQRVEKHDVEDRPQRDEPQRGPIGPAPPDAGVHQDDEQPDRERHQERDEQAHPAPGDLGQDDDRPRQVVGQHQLQRAVLLLAAHGVVGEDQGDEAHEDGDDEDEVDEREHDRQGIVVELGQVDVGRKAPDQGVEGDGRHRRLEHAADAVEVGVRPHVGLELGPAQGRVAHPSQRVVRQDERRHRHDDEEQGERHDEAEGQDVAQDLLPDDGPEHGFPDPPSADVVPDEGEIRQREEQHRGGREPPGVDEGPFGQDAVERPVGVAERRVVRDARVR